MSRRRQPRRRQPAAAQLDRSVERSDRLRLGRRQGADGDRLGAVPGAVSRRHRLPSLRLPHRRPEAGRIEDDPRQDLPDAGRFRGIAGRDIGATFPARSDERPQPGAGSSAKKLIEFGWDEPDTGFLRRHRDQLEQTPFDGCVFHVAGSTAPRRRRRISPGSAGAAGVSRRSSSSRRSTTWRRSPGRGFATTSCGSTSRPPTSTGSTTTLRS